MIDKIESKPKCSECGGDRLYITICQPRREGEGVSTERTTGECSHPDDVDAHVHIHCVDCLKAAGGVLGDWWAFQLDRKPHAIAGIYPVRARSFINGEMEKADAA